MRFVLPALLACASAANFGCQAATLLGQTSKPNFSVFTPGEMVPIQFTVSAISPGEPERKLSVKVVDEHFAVIEQKEIAVPSAGSTWTTSYLAPTSRLGFYRVYATLSTGETLPAMGSRSAGYLTYAIVPDPGQRTAYPPEEARFGMQGGFNGSVDTIPYLGINWVNGPGTWGSNEPDHAGQFAEQRAAKAASGNTGPSKTPGATRGYEWATVTRDGKTLPWPVYPVFAVYNPPSWAFIPGHKVGSTAPLKPEAYGPWGDYCKAFAQSVVEDYPNLSKHFYQITWEPNWFNGTNQQFFDIYRIAADTIHATDPKAIVAGLTKSGVGDFGMEVETQLFKMGLGDKLDGYTIHPYTKMPAENNNYLDKIKLLIAFPTKRAGHAIPVYSTEQGDQTMENPDNEISQAREVVRASLITLGEGARFYFGFYIHDYAGEPGFGYFYNLRDDKKFGSGELSPKPIVPAFAAETSLIDGHETVGPLDYLGDTALGYAFQRGDDVVLALWDYGTKPRSVTIGTGVKSVDIYDWMGNKKRVPTADGNVTLTLTQEPVYIRGVAPAVWGKGTARALDIASTSLTTMPGGRAIVTGTLRPQEGKPIDGQLTATANAALGTNAVSQAVAVSDASGKPFTLSIPVPAKAAFSTYVVDLALKSHGAVVASRKLRIDIKPPVKVAAVTPIMIATAPDGKLSLKSVRISLSSTQAQTASGSFEIKVPSLPSASGKIAFNVEPNSDPVLDLPTTGLTVTPGETYDANIVGTTSGGYRFTEPVRIALAAARPAAQPTVDGDLAEWASIPAVPLTDANHAVVGSIRFAWGQWGLGVAAEVDGAAANADGANLQIGTNIDPAKVERSTGDVFNDTLALRRFQILSMAMGKDGPEARHPFTYNFDRMHGGLIPSWDMPLKIVHTDGKTIYEAVIPWKHLGTPTPYAAGDVIGIGVAVNVPTVREAGIGIAGANAPTTVLPPAATLFGGISPKPDSNRLGDLLLAP